MSMDPSLKSKSTLERHRNVLSRAERIAILTETGAWTKEMGANGLPKVAHRKASVGKKSKAEKQAATEGAAAATTEGAPATAPAEPTGKTSSPAKPAAGAKPAAAKGGKA